MEPPDHTEHTIGTIDKCFAFQIPPITNAKGHRADTWPNQPSWCGKMVLTRKGDVLNAQLVDSNSKIFATCPIQRQGPVAVEKTLDSSRYFVLRIVDPSSNRHAFIGIAFDSRSDAFDFNVTIDDHLQQLERQEMKDETNEKIDYSLKQGETMHIALNKKKSVHSFEDWERF